MPAATQNVSVTQETLVAGAPSASAWKYQVPIAFQREPFQSSTKGSWDPCVWTFLDTSIVELTPTAMHQFLDGHETASSRDIG
jgi:hypothetical protein